MPMYVAEMFTRKILRNHPDKLFIFGDNYARIGKGGQAMMCRGEPNAFGVPTKWHPSTVPSAYFYDHQYGEITTILKSHFDTLENLLQTKTKLVWPQAGIGTGRARLQETAPAVLEYIRDRRNKLFNLAYELGDGYIKLELSDERDHPVAVHLHPKAD